MQQNFVCQSKKLLGMSHILWYEIKLGPVHEIFVFDGNTISAMNSHKTNKTQVCNDLRYGWAVMEPVTNSSLNAHDNYS